MSAHTPGPWRAIDGRSAGWFIVDREDHLGHNLLYHCAESEANARLTSAAPDLLAALQHMQVCQSCAQADWSACPRGGQQALAAIAKAKGR